MANPHKIKVCGLLNPVELSKADSSMELDFIGLIFYAKSPRNFQKVGTIPETKAKKVGVFVDAETDLIQQKIKECHLDIIQLHGDESPEFCKEIRLNRPVFKAISMKDANSITKLEKFKGCVDAFVFDTATPKKGGSGKKFNWDILKNYNLDIPFLLSGGIGPEDTELIKQFQHEQFIGLDLNSKFETQPGIKDFTLINNFIHEQ